MNLFPRIVVCAVACALTFAAPRVVAAQAASAAKPAPKAAAQPAPAKPAIAAPATSKPQAPTAAKPQAPAKPQAVTPAAPAKPQTAVPAPANPAAAAPAKPAPNATAGAPDADLAPAGYTYDPAGRRDPFVSLLTRAGISGQRGGLGVRPSGLGGLETSEVTLKGTLLSQGAYVGIVQGSDNKTYIVKSGDRLLDGEIRSITPDTMVIMQQVTDPLSLEKQREVRKLLRPTEEAK